MAISLTSSTPTGYLAFYGAETKTIPRGEKLRITFTGGTPDPYIVLNEGPPVGKKWEVCVMVAVAETDA